MQSMGDSLEQSLLADIPKLNADSQAFMRWILDRVIGVGLRDYGPWQAANDSRDMDREVADELADAVVYTGMRAIKRSLNKQRLVDEFKQAQADHWDHLVLSDHCTTCNVDAFEDAPTGEFPAVPSAALTEFAKVEGAAGISVPRTITSEFENTTGSTCDDCAAPPKAHHRAGCQWTIVVPGKEVVS